MMLIIYNQDAVEGIEDEAAVDVGVDVDVGDDVDGIEDDYHGAGVDVDVGLLLGVMLMLTKTFFLPRCPCCLMSIPEAPAGILK